MRRIFSLLIVALIGITALAQNANRTGAVAEASYGMLYGETPRVAVSMENNKIYAHYATGDAASIYLGGRARMSRYAAYDFGLGLLGGVRNTTSSLSLAFYPIGLRFTTTELFWNVSMFFSVRGGIATGWKGDYESYPENALQEGQKVSTSGLHGTQMPTYGAAYMCNAGINLNNNIYIQAVMDGRYMMGQLRAQVGDYNWGMYGGSIGFRF